MKIITPKRDTQTGELYHNCPLNGAERSLASCTSCRYLVGDVELLSTRYRVHCDAPVASDVLDAFVPPKAHDTVKGLTGTDVLKSSRHTSVEPKLDGVRAQVHITPQGIYICSRRRDSTGQFRQYQDNVPHIRDHKLLQDLQSKGYTILDGEVIMPPDKNGATLGVTMSVIGAKPEHAIWVQEERGLAVLHLFDITRLAGQDLTEETLETRREALRSAFPYFRAGCIERVPVVHSPDDETRRQAFRLFQMHGYEGAVLKDPHAKYFDSRAWLKVKQHVTIDAQITNWEVGKVGGKYGDTLGALCVSVFDHKGDLVEIANVIPGNDALRGDLFLKLGDLSPEVITGLDMIVELEGQGWSREARIRHPRIVRFRPDRSEPSTIDFSLVQRI